MANLPIFNTSDRILSQLETQWASQLNPLLANPSLQTRIIKQVNLAIGSNTINHLLGQNLVGWRIVRKRGPAEIYDTQDSNPRPQLTLVLVSDTVVSCDLEVF